MWWLVWARLDWLGVKSVLWGFTFNLKFCFLKQAVHVIDQHVKGQKQKDESTHRYSTTVWIGRYCWGYREEEKGERGEGWEGEETAGEGHKEDRKREREGKTVRKGQKRRTRTDTDTDAERLWETLATTRNLPFNTVKKWFEVQRTRYGKLTQTKSGQAAEKSTEQQIGLKDNFSFLWGHIRRKGVSKSSMFKSPLRPSASAATASVPDASRDTESEMEISLTSDVTHQPLSTGPKWRQTAVATTIAEDPVSTSLHTSCAAYTDSHNTACYSDCQRTATAGACFSVSTANILFSWGWPTTRDFQNADVQPESNKDSQHNTSGLSSLFGGIPSVLHDFHPLNFNQHRHQCHRPLIKNSQVPPASLASKVSPNEQISLHQVTPAGPSKGHLNLPKTINKLIVYAQKSTPCNTSPKYMKKIMWLNEWMLYK